MASSSSGSPASSSGRQRISAQSPSCSSSISMAPAGSSAGNSGMSESAMRCQIQSLDSNLGALCEHVQAEGWNSMSFSDIIVQAMGSTFYLHRLLLSRSSYFRNMLQGPWKEASAPEVRLQIDDDNVNSEAVATALSYLYGHHPRLDDGNAFRVLAAASFLDLQDLCAYCTDFIISELWTENFLSYQAFAESQDYGIHGERVRKACWGYLCRGGAVELREILPKLSSQTLRSLVTSDELWVPSEEKRFELALSVLVARGVVTELDSSSVTDDVLDPETGSDAFSMACLGNTSPVRRSGTQQEQLSDAEFIQELVLDMADAAAALSQAKSSYDPADNEWKMNQQLEQQQQCSSEASPPSLRFCFHQNSGSPSSWGGRVVGRRLAKASPGHDWGSNEEWETFMSIFEGGGIHFCHMPFEDLLDARARLEELGFPCKAVADGLWLQTLLRQQVLSVAADTCKICSASLSACTCRQSYIYPPHARVPTPGNYNNREAEQEKSQAPAGHPLSDASQSNNTNVQARVVRGTIDGLAGIGRGSACGPSGAPWPHQSRFMFSRVPFSGPGGRANPQQLQQQQQQHEQPEMRIEYAGVDSPSYSVDGLNMVIGLSQGLSSVPVQSDHAGRHDEHQVSRAGDVNMHVQQKLEHASSGDACQSSSISLDLHTPLQSFPPFRFGVEFDDVHRLSDGQSKHSPEVFYAGSLWKVSVQAFNDEDPRCRRTLGLFLHRRKADDSGPFRKVSLYVDTREKVTARYQLICPAKRGVMILGSLTQDGTLLPKAPKGWGWRTAFLFDELVDLLQGNSFRVAAVVQVV